MYLPQPSGMDETEYASYKARAEFFNASGRTLEGLHGLMFRKNVIINSPDELLNLFTNVDGKGNTLNQFINETAWDCMQTEWGGVLIDAPSADGVESVAEAEDAGLTPYMTYYKAENIINWRFKTIGRRKTLALVVVTEEYDKDSVDDRFTFQTVKRYRVLEIDEEGYYKQSLYDEHQTLVSEVYPTKNGQKMTHIPFYLLPATEPNKPMMLDLVNVNSAWYRKSADLENGAHWTGVPTPYCIGLEVETKYDENGNELPKDPIKLGGGKMLAFPQGVSHVGYLEVNGSNFSALQSMMAMDEDRMAILGARIISAERKGVESAETAKIHRAGENSVLATFARNLSIVFTDIAREYVQWSISSEVVNDEISVEVNTDYDIITMSPAELTALVSLWQTGGISKTVLFHNLREGEIVPNDITFDDMQAEIQEEQAIASQQALAQMAGQAQIEHQFD